MISFEEYIKNDKDINHIIELIKKNLGFRKIKYKNRFL